MKKENEVLNEFIRERINENKKLFTKSEHDILLKNKKIVRKIYILGAYDGKCTYNKNF